MNVVIPFGNHEATGIDVYTWLYIDKMILIAHMIVCVADLVDWGGLYCHSLLKIKFTAGIPHFTEIHVTKSFIECMLRKVPFS